MAKHIEFLLLFGLVTLIGPILTVDEFMMIHRPRCANRYGARLQPHSEYKDRLKLLRDEMKINTLVQTNGIDAYIIPSYDEHQIEDVAPYDMRLKYISGFSGSFGFAAVTRNEVALWTDARFFYQADAEVDCDWPIFENEGHPSIPTWLSAKLQRHHRIGADPKLFPHYLWHKWESEFERRGLKLIKILPNLVDFIWRQNRPAPPVHIVNAFDNEFTGELWNSKIGKLRHTVASANCDAIVLTSLTDIAYVLNVRGNDYPFIPVFKSYLIVTQKEIILYTDQTNLNYKVMEHLRTDQCYNEHCVKIKDYGIIWNDLRTMQQLWRRVFLPSQLVYDQGVSEAIYSAVTPHKIHQAPSPVIYMKAQKNSVEREGMRQAAIQDGAAMSDFLSYLEIQYHEGREFTELSAALECDRSRRYEPNNRGIALKTRVAIGPHGGLPHYTNTNITNSKITNESTIIIDSGGQFIQGTTIVSRTVHFGKPTSEQRTAYTKVLSGIIRLALLGFPEDIQPSALDALVRGPMWGSMQDYPHVTGHGIGTYLSVHESPINFAYTKNLNYTFKDGNFFSSIPGYYKENLFGVRLGNVLEVYDTKKPHLSGSNYLRFRETTYVPFEPKLIDPRLLSTDEKRWLNEYNAEIRNLVGAELKRKVKMQAFHWMMNKTMHIKEYMSQSDYESSADAIQFNYRNLILMVSLMLLIFNFSYRNGIL